MRTWRYGLIVAYGALALVGMSIGVRGHRVAGLALLAIGLLCIGVHMALERREDARERSAQVAWIAEVERSADDLTLASYGIPTLDGLARYHDAAGRAAVLGALRALPPGRRSLLVAAISVDPDAEWD